jgi:phage internal scaffolding protein
MPKAKIETLDIATGEITETKGVHVRQPFVYDSDKVSDDTGIVCNDLTRTKQEFAEEADINLLVKRYGLLGAMPKDHRVATFGDFEDMQNDYHTAQNKIRAADEAFQAMPPDVRYRFGNNPQALMEFVSDVNNKEEVKKLGLLAPEKAKEVPLLVRVQPEPDQPNPTPKSSA